MDKKLCIYKRIENKDNALLINQCNNLKKYAESKGLKIVNPTKEVNILKDK